MLATLRDFANETHRVIPPNAWVGDRLAVSHVVAYVLAPFHQVAFNHHAFDELAQIGAMFARVGDLAHDANLLFELFSGIRMVCIDDDGGIGQALLLVHLP